ncbi:hypothetical protein D8674_031411 [Pyrus ussuriensis x Pyrus communis]|uniref:Uncharacterized protein n=1 Tax=Pyrus ussuriensis x Pyrus communis TaxID=2448454 RepID=A0A5N5F1B0_9ROSA|nr:hypothetical protein D8674_031411 [Pyrus ussuriensis x Pyrus communis]
MADSIPNSTKSCEGEGPPEGKETYRHKRLPSIEDKSRADAYAELKFDIRGLVQNQCSTDFKSWETVPEELKKCMVRELSKFDVQQVAKRARVADVLVDAPEEEE